ncbi:terminase large subunit domain-containing protein [Wohlfahrtiimonas larvae]|uniref:Terminase ATPase subunit family protein n=2 Tax=Wohlfahrtiimonas larvae TaxID=1157986 RepID=A0ABP9MYJ5_9GAMM
MNNEPLITPQNTEPREISRLYYFSGLRISEISKIVGTPESTLYDWRKQDKWDEADFFTKCQDAFQLKYLRLLMKNSKTENEMREFKELGVQMKNIYSPKPDRKKRGAQINSDQFDWEKFTKQINEGLNDLYPFQRALFYDIEKYQKHKKSSAEFMVGKGRQIGWTYFLSYLTLHRLVNLKHNQIYISASKNQAFQAKRYMLAHVKNLTGIDLSGGDAVKFKEDLQFYFLGANPNTAQGYTGDVTLDEIFWMQRFEEIQTVVSACATHKDFIINYLSTASSKSHPAYKLWAATEWHKKKSNKKFGVEHKDLKDGRLCEDGKFRKIITVHDAIAGGFDRVDLDKLRLRYDDEQFARLFEFQFFDDLSSAFNFNDLQACMVDSWEKWTDFKPIEYPHKPFGRKKVAVGYDPARSNDGAACVVVALPDGTHKKRRILEKHFWSDVSFEAQENHIRDICERYNVVHLGIDCRNMGLAVAERVEKFYPNLTRYMSDLQLKTLFVLQAKALFRDRLVEYDSGWSDLLGSFMNIKNAMSKSNRFATFESVRDQEHGHADLANATMYAFGYEGFDGVIAGEEDDEIYEI